MTEIQSLEEVVSYLSPETLLALDVDNTLLKSAQYFGSEAWYDDKIAKWKATGISDAEANLKANDDWEAVQHEIEIMAVEKSTAGFVKSWQDRGDLKVMGLTARRWQTFETTRTQLKSLGIAFEKSLPFSLPVTLDSDTKYERGILYVGPLGNKATALSGLFSKLPRVPEKVVFVDDRLHHVLHMTETMAKLKIECHAFLYLGARGIETQKVGANLVP